MHEFALDAEERRVAPGCAAHLRLSLLDAEQRSDEPREMRGDRDEQIAFLGSAERLHPMRIEAGEQLRILRLELAIEGPGEVGEAERIVQV